LYRTVHTIISAQDETHPSLFFSQTDLLHTIYLLCQQSFTEDGPLTMRIPKFLLDPLKNGSFWNTVLIVSAASLGVEAFSLYGGDSTVKTSRGARPSGQTACHDNKNHDGRTRNFRGLPNQVSNVATSILHNVMSPKTALCSASPQKEEDTLISQNTSTEKTLDIISYGSDDPKSYYYKKMRDPPRNLVDSHAIFGALRKPGYVERYDTYRRVPFTSSAAGDNKVEAENLNTNAYESVEVCVADVRIGEKLNGHDGIVHGGIISLMLDDTFGWG